MNNNNKLENLKKILENEDFKILKKLSPDIKKQFVEGTSKSQDDKKTAKEEEEEAKIAEKIFDDTKILEDIDDNFYDRITDKNLKNYLTRKASADDCGRLSKLIADEIENQKELIDMEKVLLRAPVATSLIFSSSLIIGIMVACPQLIIPFAILTAIFLAVTVSCAHDLKVKEDKLQELKNIECMISGPDKNKDGNKVALNNCSLSRKNENKKLQSSK